MAIETIAQLKQWFETADKPTQAQFASLIDSLMHRTDGDKLAINRVEGLQELLNSFATQEQLANASKSSEVRITQEAHGFAVGDLVYNDGTQWLKAISDLNAEVNDSFATNIVLTTIDTNTFVIASLGAIVFRDLGLSGAVPLYLSQSEAGAYINVQPTTGIVQQVGWYTNGYIFFNPQVPLNISNSSPYDVETSNYKLRIKITGSRFEAVLLIKDANVNFTVPNFVPAGIAHRIDPDYMIEMVMSNTNNEVLTHRYSASKLSTDNGPELIMTTQMNEPYEAKRINFRPNQSYYYTDANKLANVLNAPISWEVNPAAYSVAYTGIVSTQILFYADLKAIV